ncbi:hypothetical protein A4A49_26417 [Nicotiana attenuata]|uniref:DUF4283 domain-containing protein n=1 Tax=Nicotiana attenuata TaxID=49451 RepID=A0A314KW43_NICAT|nr:hypothetical protein A4A49_26417 [Nicotiana attenuata]
MATAPPSNGGKPPDHSQKKRNTITHHLQQTPSPSNTQVRTYLQNSDGITIHKNRMGVSNISQAISGPPIQILNRGDCSTPQGDHSLQISDNSTVEISGSDQQKFSGQVKMKLISEPIGDQIPIGTYSTIHMDPTGKNLGQFNPGFHHLPQVESSQFYQLAGDGVSGIIGSQNQCQSIPITQVSAPNQSEPILQASISSNIKNSDPAHCSPKTVRPNANDQSSPIQRSLLMGEHSLVLRESDCFLKAPVVSQLAGHVVGGNQLVQNQCPNVLDVQGSDFQSPTPILHEQISSNIQKGSTAGSDLMSARQIDNGLPVVQMAAQNVVSAPHVYQEMAIQKNSQGSPPIHYEQPPLHQPELLETADQGLLQQGNSLPSQITTSPPVCTNVTNSIGVASATLPIANSTVLTPETLIGQQANSNGTSTAQNSQQQSKPTTTPNANVPLKISSNFDKPNNSKKHQKPAEKNSVPPVQANKQVPPAPNPSSQMNNNPTNNKQPSSSPPPPPTITHSFVNRLRARHESKIKPIPFTPPKITTKQGQPAVVFKKEDYMVKFADRCKFTIVGKFSNTMPRTETIRKSFITQTELRGGVKIAHFNARTAYIDPDNEFDHSTVWAKQHMYIQGQMIKLEAWTPAFKPNEDSPIVPIWVVIPELPWHLYYMEILTPFLSPIGKALYLDLASFQKTRGSVAKDENGDGEWLEVQYDNLPAYCTHCRHLGHSEYSCEIRLLDEEKKRRKEEDNKATSSKVQNKEVPGTSKGTQKLLNTTKGTQAEPEHQKEAEHQNISKEAPRIIGKLKKKKNFKGNSQNTKKQNQVYPPKANARQQSQAPNNSGIPSINPSAQLERSVDSGAQNQPIPPAPQSIIATASVVDMVEGVKSQVYKNLVPDPSLSQRLLHSAVQHTEIENVSSIQNEKTLSNVLASTPIEKCPLNNHSPEFDEYRPMLSEDEMSGGNEEENEDLMSENSEEEQHYDLLITAVNGEYQQQEIIGTQGLSPRKFNPSPRLTRSRAAGISTAPPLSKKPPSFND